MIMRALADALRLFVLHLSLLFFFLLLLRDNELMADIESLKSLSPSSVCTNRVSQYYNMSLCKIALQVSIGPCGIGKNKAVIMGLIKTVYSKRFA